MAKKLDELKKLESIEDLTGLPLTPYQRDRLAELQMKHGTPSERARAEAVTVKPEVDGEGHTVQLSTGKTVTGVYWLDGENGLEEFGCKEWDSLNETEINSLFEEVERLADEACRVF